MPFKESYTGNFLNLTEAYKRNPSIMHDGEILDAFPLILGKRQRYHTCPYCLSTLLEALDREIRQEKEIESIWKNAWKE